MKESIILLPKKFLTWPGFLADDDWTLRLSEPAKPDDSVWAELKSNRWTFVTKLIEGTFPNTICSAHWPF